MDRNRHGYSSAGLLPACGGSLSSYELTVRAGSAIPAGGYAAPDRTPEPWESGAAAPFLWIETPQGNVEVWALGSDRFSVRAPDHEQLVVGLEEAQQAAHALAEWLGQSRVNMTIDDSQLDPEHGHAAPLLMAVGRLVLAGAALENVLLVDIAMRDIDRAGTVRDELGRELSELEGRPAGKLLERLRNLGIPDELDGSKAAHLTTRPRLNDDVR